MSRLRDALVESAKLEANAKGLVDGDAFWSYVWARVEEALAAEQGQAA